MLTCSVCICAYMWPAGIEHCIHNFIYRCFFLLFCVVGGWGLLTKVVATFNHVGGSLNIFMATTGGVWMIPSFRIWGYVLHVEHFMCHHKLWPTSVGHPFSLLNSSWGLIEGKHYQTITITIFRFVFQNITISDYFPYIIFYHYLFSLLLQAGLLLQYAALFQSGNYLSI